MATSSDTDRVWRRDLSHGLSPFHRIFLHARPRSWPIVGLHLAAGYIVAAGPPNAGHLLAWAAPFLAAAILWAVLLNGGTLALNGAIDKDTKEVGYLQAPPPPPRGLAAVGIGLMLLGQAISLGLSWAGFWSLRLPFFYGLCLMLSILYSVPPIRLKARPGLDLLVNCAGYGALTFLAGWSVTWRPLDPLGLWAAAAFGFLFAALYPLTQIYQMEEDKRHGVRTFAMFLGRQASLWLALGTTLAGFACLIMVWMEPLERAAGLGAARWTASTDLPAGGLVLLLVPLALWLRALLPYLLAPARPCGQSAMYAALTAWAATDLLVAFRGLFFY